MLSYGKEAWDLLPFILSETGCSSGVQGAELVQCLGVRACCMSILHSGGHGEMWGVLVLGAAAPSKAATSAARDWLGQKCRGGTGCCEPQNMPTVCSVRFDVTLDSAFHLSDDTVRLTLFTARVLTEWKLIICNGWFS